MRDISSSAVQQISLEPVDIYVRIRGPRQRGSRSFRNLSGRLQIRENSAHKFSRKCGRSNILRLSALDLGLGKANLDIKTFSVMSLVSDLMIEVRSDFSS